MGRSRLPVPSLLGLLGALLMLSPGLLMWNVGDFYSVPVPDLDMLPALAVAVEEYNLVPSPNYFKALCVVRVHILRVDPFQYHFMMYMGKTTCEKKDGRERKFKAIQRCKQLRGNKEAQNCYIVVTSSPPLVKFYAKFLKCFRSGIPVEFLCSGRGF